MCGLFGVISENPSFNMNAELYQHLCARLRHRGPDDSGVFISEKIILGQTRLSILDLSLSGHQPMIDPQFGVVLVYNGEVYNFKELRTKLIQEGFSFLGGSDTEVILKCYLRWGEKAFEMLDGMFAFALYDPRINRIFIVRDFAGIKPLYYYQTPDVFAFGFEIKVFKALPAFKASITHQGLSEYLWYGNTISDCTLYEGVMKVRPGTYLSVDTRTGEINTICFWSSSNYVGQHQKIAEKDAIDLVRSTLENSVRAQLVSDVPVGICVSGGIDSSAITAFASRYAADRLKTFSVDFDFMQEGSELPMVSKIADQFGTDHHEFHISANDIKGLLSDSIEWHDEPFADAANLPLFLMGKALKEHDIKVILQGDGGDELFGGYNRYAELRHRPWYQVANLLEAGFDLLPKTESLWRRRRFLNAMGNPSESMMHALLLTVESCRASPFNLLSARMKESMMETQPFSRYEEEYVKFKKLDTVQRMLIMDYNILLPNDFLEKVDKPYMANSIEVRVPFLGKAVVELALGLPAAMKVKNGEKKYLLKQALKGIVPDSILFGKKKGFGVPYQEWLRRDLKEELYEVVSYLVQREVVSEQAMRQVVSDHLHRRCDRGFLLWKYLMLGLWMRKSGL